MKIKRMKHITKYNKTIKVLKKLIQFLWNVTENNQVWHVFNRFNVTKILLFN